MAPDFEGSRENNLDLYWFMRKWFANRLMEMNVPDWSAYE